MLDGILAEYHYQLSLMEESILKILCEHYEIEGHDKATYIEALVEHFRQQLLKGDK